MKAWQLACVSLSSVLALWACSSDEAAAHSHQTPDECVPIIEACHLIDDGTAGPVHDCHENAHEVWSAAQCTANGAQCIALCEAATPDGGTGGSAGGMGADASSDAADAD
ncbi:MAG: hypothetical protein IPI67_37065 [Myxococcales bacterium]|nr:hypothetical protein [Myxococcales bacterium]